MVIFSIVITTRKDQQQRETEAYQKGLHFGMGHREILFPYGGCPKVTEKDFDLSRAMWKQVGEIIDRKGGELEH